MSTWDAFEKTATVGEGGDDFPERPHVPDGTYHAVVTRLGEPYDKPNPQSGEMQTKFAIDFTLTGKKLRGQEAVLASFVTFPPAFLNTGVLSPKSRIYEIMKALGYDLEGSFDVKPTEWEGYTLDVLVENQTKAGVTTSWITKYLACECDDVEAEPEPVAVAVPRGQGGPPKKAPVGAGLAGRLQP